MYNHHPSVGLYPLLTAMRIKATIATALAIILIILSSEALVHRLSFSEIPLSEVTSETELLNLRELIYYISNTNKNKRSSLRPKIESFVFFFQNKPKKVISQTFSFINSICIMHCTFLL